MSTLSELLAEKRRADAPKGPKQRPMFGAGCRWTNCGRPAETGPLCEKHLRLMIGRMQSELTEAGGIL